VQETRARHSHRQPRPSTARQYLWAGLIQCRACGRRLTGHVARYRQIEACAAFRAARPGGTDPGTRATAIALDLPSWRPNGETRLRARPWDRDAAGYATVGRIGFEGRYDYAAIGTSVILASRLSSAAKAAEILISQRVMAIVEDSVEADPVADLELKGFSTATAAYAVRSCRARSA